MGCACGLKLVGGRRKTGKGKGKKQGRKQTKSKAQTKRKTR
jgi:hypothetical protein